MNPIDRRKFLKSSLMGAAALSIHSALPTQAAAARTGSAAPAASGPSIVDSFVNLFEWPYRRLKYSDTSALVEKLRQHRVSQAWAGSFEALLHKNVNAVNARLAEECRARGEGVLLPFGTVNPAWPDWEEDLRRCHEVYQMRGIRLYPSYQHFGLDDGAFTRLLEQAFRRGLLVQVVGEMEDPRVHHPSLMVREVDGGALVSALKAVPQARVQLLHFSGGGRGEVVSGTRASFDISGIEGNGGVGKAIEGGLPVDRLLFGSHAPYFPMETGVLKLFESPLNLEQLQAIMQDNAKRLLA